MKIGSHVSISGGLLGAAEEAFSYGANTFMVYTGAPQNTVRLPLEKLKIEEGHRFMEAHGLSDIVVHAPYIINLASFKTNIFETSVSCLKTELERTRAFGSRYIVLHPGAYTEKDLNYGINKIVEGLNSVLAETAETMVCLETMAGKGTEIGRNFEELAEIIERIEDKDRIGICFDTCHTHDSGYDLENFSGVMKEFDKIIGLCKLKVFHINGSLNVRGAKKDRHANIGAKEDNPKGVDHIGLDTMLGIVRSPYARDKIFILETPWLDKNTNLYKQEIALLRENNR